MAPASDHDAPKNWSADDMPSQTGKVAIVTGANSGIGFETALQLAKHGARVVMACRNEAKANAAAARIRSTLPAAADGVVAGSVECLPLDTSSLESVRHFAEAFAETHERLDLLINNAGVMAVPFGLSVDGHERQFATNHLGHFALTARLFPLLRRAGPGARVVSVSSHAHRTGAEVARERLQATCEQDYTSAGAYAQSKLYNLLFAKELARRLRSAGVSDICAVACHPGFTSTGLMVAPATERGWLGRQFWRVAAAMPVYQDAASGALPTLYAATGDRVQSGDYYGPGGWLSLWGTPVLEHPAATADSEAFAALVWEESERLAGIKFDVN